LKNSPENVGMIFESIQIQFDRPVDHRTFAGMNVDPVEMGKYEFEVELGRNGRTSIVVQLANNPVVTKPDSSGSPRSLK
jgi:hypothetical protein